VNASCLQDSVTALAMLVKYGGNLDKAEDRSNESAFVSAHRYHSNKIIKYITKLKEDAIMNYRIGEENLYGDGSYGNKQVLCIHCFRDTYSSLIWRENGKNSCRVGLWAGNIFVHAGFLNIFFFLII